MTVKEKFIDFFNFLNEEWLKLSKKNQQSFRRYG